MNKKISDELIDIINIRESKYDADPLYKKYCEALDMSKKLIKNGWLVPRGNRLMDIEKRFNFNWK